MGDRTIRARLSTFPVAACAAAAGATPLDTLDARRVAAAPGTGIALAETMPAPAGAPVALAAVGDPALKPNTSFRLAGNTKACTAATILRPWEEVHVILGGRGRHGRRSG